MLRKIFFLFTVLICLPALVAAEDAKSDKDGFTELFNGKDFTGWVIDGTKEIPATLDKDNAGKPVWKVEDGLIKCAGKGFGYLRFDKEFSDFTLKVEYRMSKDCNSGIGIRSKIYDGKDKKTRPSFAGYEIQILDDGGKKPDVHSTGSLYRYVAPTSTPAKPAGEWNTMIIECHGPKIKITLNDTVIQDVDQTKVAKINKKPLKGYFMLQNHGQAVEYRSVKIKDEAEKKSS